MLIETGPASALTEAEYNALIQQQAQQKQILDGDEPAPIEPATVQTPPPEPTPVPTISTPPPLPSGGLGGAGLVAAGVGVAALVGIAAVALGGGGGDDSTPATTGTD